MRWPLIRRSRHEELQGELRERLEKCERACADQRRALANLGHARDKAFRDAAQVMEDLRIARFHFDRNRSGAVHVAFTLVDEYLLNAYRRDDNFRVIIGYMLERAFIQEYGPAAPFGIFDDRKSGLPS